MFVDIAKIQIKAGNGGDGAVAFHREKYVASGGPDGGDGGRGGNIVFQVDDNLSTLADFRYKRKYKAENGQNGRGARCNGKKGQDLVIRVPRGTIIRECESGRRDGGYVLGRAVYRREGRQRRLGQPAFCDRHAPKPLVLRKAVRPARSGRFL